MSIKSILFDVGEVLIYEPAVKSRELICKRFGIDNQLFKNYALKNIALSYKGELNYEDFFRGLINETKLDLDYKDLVKAWIDAREETSKINEELFDLSQKLKNNYLAGLLTNSTRLNDSVKSRKEVYKSFNFKIISYEVNSMKPKDEIYKITIGELLKKKITPEETIIIDNEKNNIVAANKFGFKTILYENNQKLIETLTKSGIKL